MTADCGLVWFDRLVGIQTSDMAPAHGERGRRLYEPGGSNSTLGS